MLRKFITSASALLILLVINFQSGQGAICYKCDAHNPNCADPVILDAPGVETCIAPYCVKSVINHGGISVALRMCATSPTMEDGCINQVIGGMPAMACICKEDFCNGSH